MTYLNVEMSNATKTTTKQVLRALGAIVLVVAIVWVGMQSFRVLPSVRELMANAFVSVESFFSPAERIVVTVIDSQIVVDTPFDLSWEHRGKGNDGSYTMIYECRDNVHLARVNGSAESTIFCNTEVPLLSDETRITLIARGDVDGIVTVPFAVRFTRNNTTVVSEEGRTDLRIQSDRFDTGTSTSSTSGVTPTAPTTPSNPGTPVAGKPTTEFIPVITGPVSDPNGEPDLSVRFIAIGAVSTNGNFDEGSRLPDNGRGAIKFEVTNLGTKESGKWQFSAKLPTSPSYTYISKSQDSLFPGDKVEFIIGFTRVKNTAEGEYEILIDHNKKVDESNENNNRLEDDVRIYTN